VAEVQEAMLPMALPVLPQARIAARYLVAAEDQAAGGDWFDAVPLPRGEVALAVGDVVGHGVAASAAMGQLRAVLRHLLLTETDLTAVLTRLNEHAVAEPASRAATLAVVVLDPATGDLRHSLCGHPPPLVVHADGTTSFLPDVGTGPLGFGSTPMVADGHLDPDELVLLYSDGLVERPGRTLRDGVDELASVAADVAKNRGTVALRPERLCALTVEQLTRSGYDDDVTTLAALRLPRPARSLSVNLPAAYHNLAAARDAVASWLARLHTSQADREVLALAVGEAVTNSVEHAYPAQSPGSVHVTADLDADGVCTCRISDTGRWRAPEPVRGHRGFGLLVCERLVDACTVSHPPQRVGEPFGSRGTTVTLRHRVRSPAILGSHVLTVAAERPMAYHSESVTDGHRTTVRVTGTVDVTTDDRFAQDLSRAAHGGVLPLTVDLTKTTQLSSAAIHALHNMHAQLTAHQQELILVAPRDSTMALVLDLARLPHTEG
jgi:anti-sigma regulatory factor (Ser/Thr protein kinase)/anti-anti-sigma regulatory factor